MPSPSADPKFVLSILKFLNMLNFLKYNQNNFGIFKSEILLHKLDHLSILKTFWVSWKKLSKLKNLSILKTNFGSADGLGSSIEARKYYVILITFSIVSSDLLYVTMWHKRGKAK